MSRMNTRPPEGRIKIRPNARGTRMTLTTDDMKAVWDKLDLSSIDFAMIKHMKISLYQKIEDAFRQVFFIQPPVFLNENQILYVSAGHIGATFSTRDKSRDQQRRYRELLLGLLPTTEEIERYTKQKLVLEYELRAPSGQYQNLQGAYLEGEFQKERVRDQISGLWMAQGLQDRENTFRPKGPMSIAEEMEMAAREGEDQPNQSQPSMTKQQEKRKMTDSTMLGGPDAKRPDIESDEELMSSSDEEEKPSLSAEQKQILEEVQKSPAPDTNKLKDALLQKPTAAEADKPKSEGKKMTLTDMEALYKMFAVTMGNICATNYSAELKDVSSEAQKPLKKVFNVANHAVIDAESHWRSIKEEKNWPGQNGQAQDKSVYETWILDRIHEQIQDLVVLLAATVINENAESAEKETEALRYFAYQKFYDMIADELERLPPADQEYKINLHLRQTDGTEEKEIEQTLTFRNASQQSVLEKALLMRQNFEAHARSNMRSLAKSAGKVKPLNRQEYSQAKLDLQEAKTYVKNMETQDLYTTNILSGQNQQAYELWKDKVMSQLIRQWNAVSRLIEVKLEEHLRTEKKKQDRKERYEADKEQSWLQQLLATEHNNKDLEKQLAEHLDKQKNLRKQESSTDNLAEMVKMMKLAFEGQQADLPPSSTQTVVTREIKIEPFDPPAEILAQPKYTLDYLERIEAQFDYMHVVRSADKAKALEIYGGKHVTSARKYQEKSATGPWPILPNDDVYTVLKNQLLQRWAPSETETYQRYRFNKCRPKAGETVHAYHMRLLELAEKCGFGDQLDKNIMDRLVAHWPNEHLVEKAITKNWNKQRFLEEAFMKEKGRAAVKSIRNPESSHRVNRVETRSEDRVQQDQTRDDSEERVQKVYRQSASYTKSAGTAQGCWRCGGVLQHQRGECPAFNDKCFKCNRIGHWKQCCPTAKFESYKKRQETSERERQEKSSKTLRFPTSGKPKAKEFGSKGYKSSGKGKYQPKKVRKTDEMENSDTEEEPEDEEKDQRSLGEEMEFTMSDRSSSSSEDEQ